MKSVEQRHPILIPLRFWEKVTKTETCWIFETRKGHPYGEIQLNGKRWKAHRLLKYSIDPPPNDKLQACHHCDNPACVRPEHVFWGTCSDNRWDAVKKGRAKFPGVGLPHCRRGHKLTKENTYNHIAEGKYKARRCKRCDRERHARNYRLQKQRGENE